METDSIVIMATEHVVAISPVHPVLCPSAQIADCVDKQSPSVSHTGRGDTNTAHQTRRVHRITPGPKGTTTNSPDSGTSRLPKL